MPLTKRTPNAYGWLVNDGHAWPNREQCCLDCINKIKRWTIKYTQHSFTLCRWFSKTERIDRSRFAWLEWETSGSPWIDRFNMKRRSTARTSTSTSKASNSQSPEGFGVSFCRSDMIWYCLSVLIRIVWTLILPQRGYIHPVTSFRLVY